MLCKELSVYFLYKNVARQCLDSASSVFANLAESKGAENRKDFIHKFCIARKELNETLAWLTYFETISTVQIQRIYGLKNLGKEIYKIINASIAPLRRNAHTDKD